MPRQFSYLYSLILVLVVVLGFTGESLFCLWVVTELNMLFFVPLVGGGLAARDWQALGSSELMWLYFLSQSIGSAFFLYGVLTSTLLHTAILDEVLFLSMGLKLGLFPFFSWFLTLGGRLAPLPLFLFLTNQKILPLLVIQSLNASCVGLILIGMYLWLIPQCLSTHSFRRVLLLSSLNIVGWAILGTLFSKHLWLSLMVYYSLLSAGLMLIFFHSVTYLQGSNPVLVMDGGAFILGFLYSVAISGLPPFLGFYVKLMILMSLSSSLHFAVSFFMILTSLFLVYLYVKMFSVGVAFISVAGHNLWSIAQATHLHHSWFLIILLMPAAAMVAL